MKLTTKSRYGLRAMLDLAVHQKERVVPVSSIAARQNVSERYLEQVLAPLKKAGMINSVRGAQGGYVLGKPPDEITVGDIVRVLEGPFGIVECVDEQNPLPCERTETCVSRLIWADVTKAIADTLDSYTLADLVERLEEYQKSSRNMYYI